MSMRFNKARTIATGILLAALASSSAYAYDLEGLKGDAMGRMEQIKAKIIKSVYSDEIKSKDMLKKMDAGNNKSVSAAEYMNYMGEIFDAMDANLDNEIDAKEWEAAKNSEILVKMMTTTARQALLLKTTMDTIDDDNDQIVDRDEFVDFHQGIFEDMVKQSKEKNVVRY
jgi:hypothetical protein